MGLETTESFFEGISRAVSRDEFFEPTKFYTAQNVRILQTGRIGEVVRINGYETIAGAVTDLDVLYDMVRVDDNFAIFYKTTAAPVGGEDEYCLKLFDSTATIINTFTYRSSIVPEWGELKQYDDSLFIAPHNKILFEFQGTFIFNDFISDITHINSIAVDIQNATKADYNLTVEQTLAGTPGTAARGEIFINRNNIPSGVSVTFNVKVGADTSGDIGPFTSSSTIQEIRDAIVTGINGSASLNTNWTATSSGRKITITRNTVGSTHNGITVDIIGSDQIRVEDQTDGFTLGDGAPTFGEETTSGGFTSIPLTGFTGKVQYTFTKRDTFGGSDADSVSGSIRITLKNAVITDSIRILDTDTVENIATKIHDVLINSPTATENYDFTLIQNPGAPTTIDTINIVAKKAGKKFNTDVFIEINADGNVPIDLPDGFVMVTQVTAGSDETGTGTLEPFTTYWYTARLKFIDGHITNVCSPKRIQSEANGLISVEFDVSENNLDGTYPTLQVFRKKEGEDFFLIEEVNLNNEVFVSPFEYIDDGKPNLEGFVETLPFWTKKHKTQEVVENRYVRGNTTQFNENYDVNNTYFTFAGTDVSTQVDNDLERDVAPYNSRCYIYVRPQYTDGTLGFFKEVGELEINSSFPQKITVQQNTLVTGIEKTINDLRFYGRYLPFGEEQNYPFNAAELQTPNLPSLEDPNINPTQTKTFFGYKYITVADDGTDKEAFVFASGWDKFDSDGSRYIGSVSNNRSLWLDGERLMVNVHGTTQSYIPVAEYTSGTNTDTIYKLEVFDALEDAVATGNLEIRLNRSNVRSGLSQNGGVSDDDLLQLKTKVSSIDDKTLGRSFRITESEIDIDGFDVSYERARLVPPDDCRIYLVLNESLLDEIDNQNINLTTLVLNNNSDKFSLSRTARISFELINFEEVSAAVFDTAETNTIKLSENNDYEEVINITPAKYILINRELSNEQQVIYFGQKPNETDVSGVTLDTTGFTFNKRSNLSYSRLAPYNIYDTLIKQSDFNFNRLDFPNQIIWSNPLLENNYFSGGRNFTLENFYNVPTENGELIDLVSLSGNLYAFCERGVARLLIGETLTQQRNGQVFVDSSGFITKHLWLIENTSPIKRESIVKKDGTIYFTDGNDVYKVGQSIDNISQGVLSLSEDTEYFASVVSLYDEYRLCDPAGEMFVYNMKYDTWYGPHTYTPEKTVETGGNIYSYEGGLIREDTGNTFGGTAYDSVLESVGNDTEIGAIDKTYRKFYMDVDGDATFNYGKTFSTPETVALASARVKNGYYHVGIKGAQGNSKKIYWKLTSQDADFALKGFRTAYNLKRNRR